MTRLELLSYFEDKMQTVAKAPWDNDGLLLAKTTDREVKKVLISLDVTLETAEYAIRHNVDVILTHHPLIFRPILALTPNAVHGELLSRLFDADIAVFSYHTRLDAVDGGVNDTLASLLGLTNVEVVDNTEGVVRLGNITPINARDFCQKVKEKLNAPHIAFVLPKGDCMLSRVAVCGGEGKDYIAEVRKSGAQLYLSGSLGYHALLEAKEGDMAMLQAGHYYTEVPVCQTLADWLKAFCPSLDIMLRTHDEIEIG